ncbi:MAG TPA: HupE/UreJ family protein [Myxococcota bacterium]|nr:HupE/UreJ family protein [Myxococcota bacterium]
MSPLGRRSRTALVCGLAVATPAGAHAHTLPVGDFYAGLLQPVLHAPSLLLVLGVALAATQLAGRARAGLPLAFCAGTAAGALAFAVAGALPGAEAIARVGAAALGVAVALHRVPGGVVGALLAGLLGAAQGAGSLAAEPDLARPALYALGVACAPLPAVGALQLALERFPHRALELAVRVAGSWVAAIAVLAAAVELAAR